MDMKTQAIINELSRQRNQYCDTVALLMGELAERDGKIAELQVEVDKLTPKPDAPAP